MKSPVIDKKSPRGTGEKIIEQMHFEICKLINARKKILKLVRDFVDNLSQQVNYDNRIHCSFNQCGTDTGRFSCTDPNLQQIPSHAKDIRLMFKASKVYNNVNCINDSYILSTLDEVEVNTNKWKKVKDLIVGDSILNSDSCFDVIVDIKENIDSRVIFVKSSCAE